jgi:IclR family mhp operon transcriptional activator
MRNVRSLLRGLEILRLLNIRNGMTISQLVQASGLSRGTVFRMLVSLSDLGFVRRNEATGGYELTAKVLALSHGFDDENWPSDVAKPLMQALGRKVGWPIVLSTLVGATNLVRETTDEETALVFRVIKGGYRMSALSAASGWVLVANLPPAERKATLALIERAPEAEYRELARNKTLINKMLGEIQRDGYCVRSRDEIRQTIIAVPVNTPSGTPLAALSLRFFSTAMSQAEALSRYLAPLQETARKIGAAYEQRNLTAPTVSDSHAA